MICLLIAAFGCNYSARRSSEAKDTLIHHYSIPQAEINFNKKILDLLKVDSTANNATKLIDSLLLVNPNNGFLFFQKGFLNEYNMHFNEAILCYKKAKDLGYDKKFYEDKISFCEKLLNDQLRFKKGTEL